MIEGDGSGFPPEARRDGRQRFEKEKGGRGRRNRVKRSGGVGGGAAPPQKQDVTEEKGLEKKRVIEGEGSGLKGEARRDGRAPPEARRDGREGFGKEEGD